MDELKDILQPGKIVQVYYNKNNRNNEIRHIRAIVDSYQVVYCVWFEKKEYWYYFVVHIDDFEYIFDKGHLREYKDQKGKSSNE
jgi:hypothetical protein